MATTIISVSIPMELAQFLEENEGISPSKIVQNKLFEMKNDKESFITRVRALEIRNGNLSKKLNDLLMWCEEQKVIIPANVLD